MARVLLARVLLGRVLLGRVLLGRVLLPALRWGLRPAGTSGAAGLGGRVLRPGRVAARRLPGVARTARGHRDHRVPSGP